MSQRNKTLLGIAIALITSFAASFLLVGDYLSRLADTHGDNGIVFYTYYFLHPEEFQKDLARFFAVDWMHSSLLFWGPAYLEKFGIVKAQVLDQILLYCQMALVTFVSFFAAFKLSRSLHAAFLAFAVSLASWPIGWSLANYPVFFHHNLYTVWAFGLFIPFLAALFYQQIWMMALFLIFSSLLHPAYGAYGLGTWFIGGFFYPKLREKKSLITFLLLSGAAIIQLLLLPDSKSNGSPLSLAEHMEALRNHIHAYPWRHTPGIWNQNLWMVLTYTLLGTAAVQMIKEGIAYRKFWKFLLVSAFLLSLSQFMGILFQIPQLILLTSLRYWSFVSQISIVLLSLLAWKKRDQYIGVVLFSALAIQAMQSAGVYWPIVLLSLYSLWKTRKKLENVRKDYFILFTVLLIPVGILFFPALKPYFYFGSEFVHHSYDSRRVILSLLSSFGMLILIYKSIIKISKYAPHIYSVCLGLLLAIGFLQASYYNNTKTDYATDLVNAQLWARNNTPPGTLFISPFNFRSLSQRPQVVLLPGTTNEIYTPIVEMREHRFDLMKAIDEGTNPTHNPERKYWWEHLGHLNNQAIINVQSRFGGEYLIWEKTWANLPYPTVFEGKHLKILKLQ